MSINHTQCCYLGNDNFSASLKASNISLYDVDSLSNTPSLPVYGVAI
jgi:hypothetical protein